MFTKAKDGFSSADLKLFAILFMLLDHIGAIVIGGYLMQSGFLSPDGFYVLPGTPEPDLARWLYYIEIPLRLAGRIAFPLFAFLIVQGFFHTRSRKNYLLRLAAFALISEIPFYLAVSLIEEGSRNVYFTLALGLLCIWGLELVKEETAARPVLAVPGALAVLLSCCVAAWYIDSDYSYGGVLCIAAFYLFRNDPVCGAAAAGAILTLLNPFGEYAAFFCIFFISRYNGQKGSLPLGKYFFYAFYPGHLLLLYGIAMLILKR